MVFGPPGVPVAGADLEAERRELGGEARQVPGRENQVVQRPRHLQTSRDWTRAALMKLANSGCGSNGRDFSSG